MYFIIVSALIIGFLLKDFFYEISYLSVEINKYCLALSPPSAHQEFYQSLVCGKKLQTSPFKNSLQHLGLIHLFVVSGAHLHFLSRLLAPVLKCLRISSLRLPLLLAFVATTAFPMAALRAWVFLALGDFSKNHDLHLSPHQRLLVSVVFCLSLAPDQIYSIGLPLSWMACLGLILGRQALSQSALVYVFTFPIIATIQWLSPWSIAINTFLAPWVGSVLFPISFLTVCLSWLQPLGDLLWSLFNALTMILSKPLQTPPSPPWQVSPLTLWLYCLVMHFVIQVIIQKRRQ